MNNIELPLLQEIKMDYGGLSCNLMDQIAPSIIKYNSKQSHYLFPSHSCNNPRISSFIIENSQYVKEIVVGDDCFEYVTTVRLSNIPSLGSIFIGKNSFTHHKDSYGKIIDNSFSISNCEELYSITIGRFSFSDYYNNSVSSIELVNCFELDLPNLQSLSFGDLNEISYNFYYADFIIQSIH